MRNQRVHFFYVLFLIILKTSISNGGSVKCQDLSEFLSHPKHVQSSISISLTQLVGFDYVRHALLNNFKSNDKVCLQVLSVAKGTYQYYKYFIELTVLKSDSSGSEAKFYLYFQDASTQAFHNYIEKPWVGLDSKKTKQFLLQLQTQMDSRLKLAIEQKAAELESVSAPHNDVIKITDSNFYKNNTEYINANTESYWWIDENTFIYSWMRRLSSSSNPFLNQEISQGLYFKIDRDLNVAHGVPLNFGTTGVSIEGENISLIDYLNQNLLNINNRALGKDWSSYLYELSTR